MNSYNEIVQAIISKDADDDVDEETDVQKENVEKIPLYIKQPKKSIAEKYIILILKRQKAVYIKSKRKFLKKFGLIGHFGMWSGDWSVKRASTVLSYNFKHFYTFLGIFLHYDQKQQIY